MITARELEDLLRECEQKRLVKPGYRPQLRYKCSCGQVHTHLTDLHLCSARHERD